MPTCKIADMMQEEEIRNYINEGFIHDETRSPLRQSSGQ